MPIKVVHLYAKLDGAGEHSLPCGARGSEEKLWRTCTLPFGCPSCGPVFMFTYTPWNISKQVRIHRNVETCETVKNSQSLFLEPLAHTEATAV